MWYELQIHDGTSDNIQFKETDGESSIFFHLSCFGGVMLYCTCSYRRKETSPLAMKPRPNSMARSRPKDQIEWIITKVGSEL